MSDIAKPTDSLGLLAGGLTVGSLIAAMQRRTAVRTSHFATPIIFGNLAVPKLAPTVNTRDDSIMRKCACCHRHIDPVLNVDYDAVFCIDCISPMSDIDFPEYYCDIGGSG